MQGMVLNTAVDSNVLSYPVPIIMKEQGAVVGRDGASPQTSGEVESTPKHWARRSLPLDVGQGGVTKNSECGRANSDHVGEQGGRSRCGVGFL